MILLSSLLRRSLSRRSLLRRSLSRRSLPGRSGNPVLIDSGALQRQAVSWPVL